MTVLGIVTISKDNLEELHQTVDSIVELSSKLVQTTIELVIVDSSHISNSFFHSSNFNSISLRYCWTQPNGIYSAMNLGISLLPSVDLIWFLNSGCLASEKIPFHVDKITITPFSIYCASVEFYDKFLLTNRLSTPSSFNYLFPAQPVNHQGILYSADIFQSFKYRYNKCYKISADFDLFLRLMINRVSIHFIPCLLATRINENGISSIMSSVRAAEYITIVSHHLSKKPFLLIAFPYLLLDWLNQSIKKILFLFFPRILCRLSRLKRLFFHE